MRLRNTGLIQRNDRGMVALFLAIVTVAIMTFGFTEYQYENVIHLNITRNGVDNIKARYLAKSSLNFSILLLYIQKQYINGINRTFKMNLQIWQQFPMSSDLLKMFLKNHMAFLTAYEDEQAEADQDETKRVEGAGVAQRALSGEDTEESDSFKLDNKDFFEFEGNFYSEISDESRKYNVNFFSSKFKAKTLEINLMALFSQPEYELFFEQERENEQVISPEEVIGALRDWVDTDDERSGVNSGAEDDRYQYLEDPYRNKNGRFTSLDELHFVYGVDDDFMENFRETLTIYGDNAININSCDDTVIRSIIFGIVKEIPPSYLEPYSLEMAQLVGQIIQRRSMQPFASGNDFYSVVNSVEGITVDNVKKKRFQLATESTVFKVTAYGEVGSVMKKVTAVVDIKNLDQQYIYYREE